MRKLTKKQIAVLEFIAKYSRLEQKPPTIQEIANKFGIKSSTAFSHVKALIRKGKVTKDNHSPRSIRLTKKDKNFLSSYFIREDGKKFHLVRYDITEDAEQKIATFAGRDEAQQFMQEVGYGRVEAKEVSEK